MTDSTEREAFEAWARADGFNTHRDDTDKYREYHRAITRCAWKAWQARAALAAQAPQPQQAPLSDEQIAGRYRWLRENVQWQEGIRPVLESQTGTELDTAIDAAIRKHLGERG